MTQSHTSAENKRRGRVTEALKRAVHLIDKGQRKKWVLLVGLVTLVSIVEALGALFLFTIIAFFTGAVSTIELPLLGNLSGLISDGSREGLLRAGAIVAGVFFLFRALLVVTQSYFQNRIAHDAGIRLSMRLLFAYVRMPYEWHLSRNSAELIRNATESVSSVISFALVPAVSVVSEALVLVGLAAVVAARAPIQTALAVGVIIPLALILLRVLLPMQARLGKNAHEAYEASLQTLQQALQGIRDVKLSGKGRYFVDKLGGSEAVVARGRALRSTLAEMPRAVLETTLVVFLLLFLALSVDSAEGSEQLALLGLFAYAVVRMMPALNRIMANLNLMKYGMVSLDEVHRALIDAQAYEDVGKNSDLTVSFKEEIALEDVSYTYPASEHPALEGISLRISKGETLGIVGSTGAGKSTLADIILGLLIPTSGRITIDGMDPVDALQGWQKQLGMVSQSVFLIDDTLRRNIAIGLHDEEIDDEQVTLALKQAELDEFVSRLPDGVETLVGERGTRLSGGERQRVAIARAIYRRPAVLVLDEGTSALDNVTEEAITRSIQRMDTSPTVIWIAHRLTTVRACNRIVVMKRGRILDVDSYDELIMRSSEFQRLSQVKVQG